MNKNTEELIKKHTYFNHKFFAKWAPYYDIAALTIKPLRYEAARRLLLHKGSRVLDVATGTGEQALALAKAGYDVTGIDLSPEMLEQAKKKLSPKLQLRFIHADATDIPFTTNSFDGASISLGLHDMPYEIRLLVLNEIKRVVKPNGHIMIIDYREPQQGLRAYLLHVLVRKLETPMYQDFIRRGLNNHLETIRLKPFRQEVVWGGIQIKVCKNDK